MADPFTRPPADDARILVEFEGRPLARYAIMLQLQVEGRWQTIRLLDNAHGDHDTLEREAARRAVCRGRGQRGRASSH